MKKITILAVLSVAFLINGIKVQAELNPRERDLATPRDRVAAFCDPATYPRELRGDFIDCPPTPTERQYPTATPPQPSPTDGQILIPTATITQPPIGGLPETTSTITPSTTPTTKKEAQAVSANGGGDGGNGGEDGGNGGEDAARVGGVETGVGQSQVLGLSVTASDDLEISDIIFLSGILCLLFYLKSKFGSRSWQ